MRSQALSPLSPVVLRTWAGELGLPLWTCFPGALAVGEPHPLPVPTAHIPQIWLQVRSAGALWWGRSAQGWRPGGV